MLSGMPIPWQMQVVCAAHTDEDFKKQRCSEEEFERRYGQFGVHKVWRCEPLNGCCHQNSNPISSHDNE